MEWNPGTLAGVLANERHCGDVLARKTFTPNFLTHKSKKNNNDRTQYRQKNHHEAIVSREVFNAANHLRASRNYSKKNRPLPVLSVVEDGILRGYVPFDKDWTGFSAEEYRKASESVMKEPDVTVTADVKKRLDLTGYEIVRVQYFSTMQNPAMTISNGRLRFNTACLKKFENVEYVELLLNSVERCIAMDIEDLEKQAEAIRVEQIKLYESYADGVLLRDAYIEKKKALSEKLAALQDSIRTEKEEQECADELDEEIRALTKQASEKTYIGGLTKECVDAFVSMVYLYDDQTMKIEFNCEDVIRRAMEKYGA